VIADGVRTLRSLLDEGRRFDAEHAVHIILESCKAFSCEDTRGVLSPTRILVSGDGTISLDGTRTHAALVAGFGYVAPENIPTRAGSAGGALAARRLLAFSNEIDRPLAAVFALGCVLWELLAGRPLFRDQGYYLTMQAARAAIVPPLSHVPRELDAVVRRALAKDIVERYRNPGDLAHALGGFLLN
jgi:hypothetical protein